MMPKKFRFIRAPLCEAFPAPTLLLENSMGFVSKKILVTVNKHWKSFQDAHPNWLCFFLLPTFRWNRSSLDSRRWATQPGTVTALHILAEDIKPACAHWQSWAEAPSQAPLGGQAPAGHSTCLWEGASTHSQTNFSPPQPQRWGKMHHPCYTDKRQIKSLNPRSIGY